MPIGFVVAMPVIFGIVLGLIVWAGIKEREEQKMTKLNSSATTVEVAGRAVYKFKKDFPDRIAIWVEDENNNLQFTVSSIHRTNTREGMMRKHLFNHAKDTFKEV